jgi:hypothetical protein
MLMCSIHLRIAAQKEWIHRIGYARSIGVPLRFIRRPPVQLKMPHTRLEFWDRNGNPPWSSPMTKALSGVGFVLH